MKLFLFFLMFCCLGLTSCNQLDSQSQKGTSTPDVVNQEVQKKIPPAEMNPPLPPADELLLTGIQTLDSDEKYAFSIPDTFLKEVQKEGVDFSYINKEAEMGFFSISKEKKENGVIGINNLIDTYMQDFSDMSLSEITETIGNSQSYIVVDRKYVGKFEGKESVFFIRGIEFATHNIIVVAFTTPKNLEKNSPVLFDLIDSLRWKK